MIMDVRYQKLAPAVRSWAAYTGSRPASWRVVVDGVERGQISGHCPDYSRDRRWLVVVDGRRIGRLGFSSLAAAKVAVETAVAADLRPRSI